ncbi:MULTISPECIES: helix-turn-helix domain-containing protein [unclassified Mycolicibacterium]|uniref:helix-turn-helix domain-containing protein n=1 Tax=unclassified Mycolicibacterium TaxID=2636767 RepID=UPI002815F32B|nr:MULTISPECIES: helix-turn-helix domain-containing protein [unclassified Mycolicibacterium]
MARAAAVISAIADAGNSCARLAEVVRVTGTSKTTAHRLLRTLCDIGWVDSAANSTST